MKFLLLTSEKLMEKRWLHWKLIFFEKKLEFTQCKAEQARMKNIERTKEKSV